jgi:hypothetical protein
MSYADGAAVDCQSIQSSQFIQSAPSPGPLRPTSWPISIQVPFTKARALGKLMEAEKFSCQKTVIGPDGHGGCNACRVG